MVVMPEYLAMLLTLLGKNSIETPLFTIPSFLESNRGSDILFTNFSWYQLKENLVCMVSTIFFGRDKAVPVRLLGLVRFIT